MGSVFNLSLSFLVFVTTFYLITATGNVKDESWDRGAHSDRGALWFGPRLGKRSLQLSDEDKRYSYLKFILDLPNVAKHISSQAFVRLLEAAETLKYYYDQMQADAPQKVTKKVIFTPKLGRAVDQYERKFDNFDFTPRLGRRLPERVPATPSEEDVIKVLTVPKPNNYFQPRLGRNYNFSPRLGRELYDLYPEAQVRVARSVNQTKY